MFNGFNQAVGTGTASRHAQDAVDRRRFLRITALAGLGVAGVGAVGATAGTAFAGAEAARQGPGDVALLTFLLNVQYLVAEYFLRAAFGKGLADDLVGGAGRVGHINAGRAVGFTAPRHRQLAEQMAIDAQAHVSLLRTALGPARIGRPELDLDAGFDTFAAIAGLVEKGGRFDAFAGEDNFLLGAFLFADLQVTAYRGVLPLLSAPFLDASSGMLANVAQHAGVVRTMVLDRGLEVPAGAVSDARASLDGRAALDQGVVIDSGRANAAPADGNGITPSRSPGRVLNIVYQNPRSVTSGGFFPWGVNGEINRSDATV